MNPNIEADDSTSTLLRIDANPDISRGTRELRGCMRDADCARGAQSNAQRHWRALERKPAPAGAAQTRVAPAVQTGFITRMLNLPIHRDATHALGGDLVKYPGSPLALLLPIGSAVFVIRGEVWLTQDGCTVDFILGAGRRFDVKSDELILVSATRGDAKLYVAHPAIAAAAQPEIPDYLRGAGARSPAQSSSRFGARLFSGATSLLERTRALLAFRAHAPTN